MINKIQYYNINNNLKQIAYKNKMINLMNNYLNYKVN